MPGSADITKRAMIAVHHDPIMKDLGFKLLLCVHDELIGECPIENAEEAGQRLSRLMLEAPKPECTVPFKCDSSSIDYWYQEEYETWVRENYEKLLNGDPKKGTAPVSEGEAFTKLCEIHGESLPGELQEIINKK